MGSAAVGQLQATPIELHFPPNAGYQDASFFYRAFRDWDGVMPALAGNPSQALDPRASQRRGPVRGTTALWRKRPYDWRQSPTLAGFLDANGVRSIR